MKRFENKVAIVTGAGGGIGRATAVRFASEGAKVTCVDVNEDGLAQTVKTITEAGGEALLCVCDVSDEEQVKSTVQRTIDKFGQLDHLANVAGVLFTMRTHECKVEDFERIVGINLKGTFLFCRESIPHLLKTKGTIVNTSSTSALGSHPWMAVYAASKGGVVSLTKSISVEYIQDGLRANCVIPGAITTNIHFSFQMPDGGNFKLMRGAQPHIEMGKPEDVAGAIVYLSSDDAKFVHGTELLVDGGAMN